MLLNICKRYFIRGDIRLSKNHKEKFKRKIIFHPVESLSVMNDQAYFHNIYMVQNELVQSYLSFYNHPDKDVYYNYYNSL